MERPKIKTIYNPRYSKILKRLIEARIKADISQKELALALNINQSDISKIEHGQRKIDITEFLDWLKVTRVDINQFISELLINYE
jgi:transcriptional regulator with XRE-family HTH domain